MKWALRAAGRQMCPRVGAYCFSGEATRRDLCSGFLRASAAVQVCQRHWNTKYKHRARARRWLWVAGFNCRCPPSPSEENTLEGDGRCSGEHRIDISITHRLIRKGKCAVFAHFLSGAQKSAQRGATESAAYADAFDSNRR
jgi:hypothetical protein